MKRLFIILIVWLYPVLGFGSINECLTDVYFGNGILTEKKDARDNAGLLRTAIIEKLGGLKNFNERIGKVSYAYNSTWDRSHDMLEAYLQLDREAPDFFDSLKTWHGRFFSGNVIEDINDEIAAAKVDEALVRFIHNKDLSQQIKVYTDSIKLGHRVLILAHSQGTQYANEVYERMGMTQNETEMKKYMASVFVAPSSSYQMRKESHSPSFTFGNDPISVLARHFNQRRV